VIRNIDEVEANTYSLSAQGRDAEEPNLILRVMVGVRLTPEDSKRLDALAEQIPVASKHSIAREAMRIGLDILEADPNRLVRRKKKPARRTFQRRG
jgi:hypothetical protein